MRYYWKLKINIKWIQWTDRQIYNEFVAQFVKLSDEHIKCMNTEHFGSIIVPNDNFWMPQMAANDGFNTTSDIHFSHF
jgi:hypothetical protein